MKLFGNTPQKRPKPDQQQDVGGTVSPGTADDDFSTPEVDAALGSLSKLQAVQGLDDFHSVGALDDEMFDEGYQPGRKRSWSTKQVVLFIAASVLATLLIVCVCVAAYFLGMINYQAANSSYFKTVSNEEELPEESPASSYMAALEAAQQQRLLEATDAQLAAWDNKLDAITSDESNYIIPNSGDVYNILLIGTDNRSEDEVGRSDAMILVSINQKTKTIYLSSFLRDCYVNIEGYGHTRLNHAFAYGGPALLEETLKENFKVSVDRYVYVDFYSFMDAIDVLGGLSLEVTEDELHVTDDYIYSMNMLLGQEWSSDYIWQAGWQHLNGKQVLAYARNRYTGNDYERTQRQRTVIQSLINKALCSTPATLVSLAQCILPDITTDMTKTEILDFAANAPAYISYALDQQQIPAMGSYEEATISGMSVISVDFDSNIQLLHDTIYSGTTYDAGEAAAEAPQE